MRLYTAREPKCVWQLKVVDRFSSSLLSHVSTPAAGSYVALTVLGRPPGLPQIPLGEEEEDEEEDQEKAEEEEKEEEDEGSEVSPPLCLSPALPGVCGEQRSSWSSSSPQENSTSSLTDGVRSKRHFFIVWSKFL